MNKIMYCANCIYWENDICYRKGIRVSSNNNICEKFIYENDDEEYNIK